MDPLLVSGLRDAMVYTLGIGYLTDWKSWSGEEESFEANIADLVFTTFRMQRRERAECCGCDYK